jgi:zinc protease
MKPTTRTLPCGLEVILKESHAAPVVAFQFWVGVGSADEDPVDAGMAHVLEHMLFKGTSRRGVGRIAQDVERAGGYINAWTSLEETVYHLTIASRFAEQGLDVLADAVSDPALDRDELERELKVILEEIRMGRDNPGRQVTELLFGQVFRGHPYGRPVIGHEHTVRGFTRERVRRFHRHWYTPRNMVLVVVGDFDEARMLGMVRQATAGWRGPRGTRRGRRVPLAVQRGMRGLAQASPVAEANLAIGFPTPGLVHEDIPALDLLAAVVGQGASSRLEHRVRRGLGVVNDVSAMAYSPRDAGVFAVFASCAPGQLVPATRAVSEELIRVTREPIPPREIAKARALIESDAIYSEEAVDGLARKLGHYRIHVGDVGFEQRYLAGLAAAGPATLLEVARRTIRPSRTSLSVVAPPTRGGPAALRVRLGEAATSAWNGRPGRNRSAAGSRAPGAVVSTLSSGDTLIVKPDAESRLVAVRVAALGGLRFERAAEAGLTTLLANALTRGTRRRSPEEVGSAMDELACSIAGFTGRNTGGIQGEFLARRFAEGFELLAECLRFPALAEAEIEREKELLAEEIRSSRDRLDQQAFLALQRGLYGSHPYGRSILGTEESVARLAGRRLRAFLERQTAPGRLTVAVVGGVDPGECRELAERYLARNIPGKGGEPRLPGPVRFPGQPRQVMLDLPKEQSHLAIGFPGTTLLSEDRFAVEVLVELLGGHGGRLFAAVRERASLAYSVSAISMEGVDPGYLALYAGTAPGQERAVVDAMLGVADGLVRRKVPAEELARVRNHLIGSRAILWQRVSARAAGAALGHLYGLGHDADERYAERIRAVDAKTVLEAAVRYLDPRRRVIACVGPRADRLELL